MVNPEYAGVVNDMLRRGGNYAVWVGRVRSTGDPHKPGAILHALIQTAGYDGIRGFSRISGMDPGVLSKLINGKRSITAETAIRLAEHLDIDPGALLAIQSDWDLFVALKEKDGS